MTVRHDAAWHSGPVQAAVTTGDLGKIVRALRTSNHLTLAQLAARCGYSAATLSRLETGKQPLRDVVVLRNLARALGVPPDGARPGRHSAPFRAAITAGH